MVYPVLFYAIYNISAVFKKISEPCVMSTWSDWRECTKSCGNGTSDRSRKILQPSKHGGQCLENLNEQEDCNTQDCPGKSDIAVLRMFRQVLNGQLKN